MGNDGTLGWPLVDTWTPRFRRGAGRDQSPSRLTAGVTQDSTEDRTVWAGDDRSPPTRGPDHEGPSPRSLSRLPSPGNRGGVPRHEEPWATGNPRVQEQGVEGVGLRIRSEVTVVCHNHLPKVGGD